MAPVGVIWLFLVLTSIFPPFRGYPPTQASNPPPPFHLVGVLVVFATPIKIYQKWQEVQLAIHSIVGE